MTDGEKLGYLAGLAAMYRTANNEFEKSQIMNNMIMAGGSLGMYFYQGMTDEAMYQAVLSRTDIVWMIPPPIVFMPPEPAPIVQCRCATPQPVLEFPKGGFWDIIAQGDE